MICFRFNFSENKANARTITTIPIKCNYKTFIATCHPVALVNPTSIENNHRQHFWGRNCAPSSVLEQGTRVG